jgi:hypothetical protein
LQPARPVPRGTRASGRAPRGVERGEELIGRAAHPVTRNRTRSVTMGALWTTIGRWHCHVWSLRGACPVGASLAQALCDRHVQSIEQRIRSIVFDHWRAVTVEIGRSMLNVEGHMDGAWRPDTVQRVRSVRPARPVIPKFA